MADKALGDWNPEEAELLRALFLEEADRYLQQMADAQQALAGAVEGTQAGAEALDSLLRPLHTLKGAAGSVGFDAVARATHDLEEICADVRAGALASTPGILECIDEGVAKLRALLEGARAEPRDATDRPTQTSDAERRSGSERRAAVDRRTADTSVRVDSDRLDALLDGVGDLVILRTRVERRLRELEGVRRDLQATRGSLRDVGRGSGAVSLDAVLDRVAEVELELSSAIGYLDRATKALGAETESLRRTSDQVEEELRRARLVPLGWLYSRLASALREIERTSGLQADVRFGGAEVELDKNVVEQLAEPMLHLLRNAVAHGIEPPEVRAARGKPARGRISIDARLEGEFVYLQFEDDGRGIDRELVRQALVQTGRLAPAAPLREELLLAAIFEPGFSSRRTADALAGRGMGLNVVKKAAVALGGDVQVAYSEGAFTRFMLSVPLTASITQALLFKVGGQVYAVPAAHVVEALPVGAEDGLGRGARGGLPVLRLQSLLGAEMPPGRRGAALHFRFGERSFLATCDKVIGPRTIVVRPLGPLLGQIPLFAGVTVSGAGKAQLVLDLGALAEAAGAPPRPAATSLRRGQPRVLVVDDSRLSREAAARQLAAAGYHPVTADDGFEAWEMMGERRFDAVVTDLEMPRLDGLDLIERIRREPTLRGLPVLVLSSRTSKATRERLLAAGANAVLPKVASKRALADALGAVLGEGTAKTEGKPGGILSFS